MKKLFLILFSLLLAAPVMAQSPADTVAKANSQWNAALNGGDIDALMAIYTDNATLSPGNGKILEGKAAIRELLSGFINNGVHNHQIETSAVYAADKQITQVGYWHAEGVDADNQATKFGGVLVTVLQQNDEGQWQLQSHVWNMAP
jgi:uncharacterized protein (TIGR02246 family)